MRAGLVQILSANCVLEIVCGYLCQKKIKACIAMPNSPVKLNTYFAKFFIYKCNYKYYNLFCKALFLSVVVSLVCS